MPHADPRAEANLSAIEQGMAIAAAATQRVLAARADARHYENLWRDSQRDLAELRAMYDEVVAENAQLLKVVTHKPMVLA